MFNHHAFIVAAFACNFTLFSFIGWYPLFGPPSDPCRSRHNCAYGRLPWTISCLRLAYKADSIHTLYLDAQNPLTNTGYSYTFKAVGEHSENTTDRNLANGHQSSLNLAVVVLRHIEPGSIRCILLQCGINSPTSSSPASARRCGDSLLSNEWVGFLCDTSTKIKHETSALVRAEYSWSIHDDRIHGTCIVPWCMDTPPTPCGSDVPKSKDTMSS